MANIMLYSAFDPSKLEFGKIEKTKRGSKIVQLTYDGRTRIHIQTPKLQLPFGVNKPYQDGGDVQSHSIDVSFRGHDTSGVIGSFLEKMRAVDASVMDHAVRDSAEWFGSVKPHNVIQEFFRPLVREPTNPVYAPTMKVKIPVVNGVPNSTFFINKEQVDMDKVCKGATARFLLELSGVWFVNKHFGVSWRVVQCDITHTPMQNPSEYTFMDEAEDEDDPAPDPQSHAFLD